MPTEKLYYKDSYIDAFTARVLSVENKGGLFGIELDKTAFFPEEGGQSSDTGYIGNAYISDVKEVDGRIYHYSDRQIGIGEIVDCKINFEERFSKMQCHTAEHIVCGLFHSIYGYENVGFHLAKDYVTFDLNAYTDRDVLDKIELLANRVVYENVKINTYFPNPEELSSLSYRSKLDIKENVRLVEIGEYDCCACCAPHVNYTGEIGAIKLLDFEKHRGGTRIFLQAGERALMDYRSKYKSVKRISELTCTPQEDVDLAVEKLCLENERLSSEIKQLKLKFAATAAESLVPQEGNIIELFSNFSIDELREYSNIAVSKTGGILVALSGKDGDYKYIIASRSANLKEMSKDINLKLCGKGGGRPEMIQGSFCCSLEQIKEYFAK